MTPRFAQVSTAFDPMLLTRQLFVQVIQLLERSGSFSESGFHRFFRDFTVIVGVAHGIFVDFQGFDVQRLDSLGNRLAFSSPLLLLALQLV